MTQNFYITTTLPYVNAEPHIGFGLEIVEADVIARYQKSLGKEVIFNTGTDEHGQKIYQKAIVANQDPLDYCSQYATKFQELKKLLNLNYTHFIRTTDTNHQQAAQAFWLESKKSGDIYKAKYQVKYCVGCELEKTESELTNGKCPIHPHLELEERDEENYFFRFSKYQKQLLEFFEKNPDFVQPESKMKEAIAFVKTGLKDFSISRLKSKMPWGVTVPNDSEHVMYVWFDALVNYVSTLGWPTNSQAFNEYWPAVQVAGKDNLRQQAIMWQAMLMSANLPPSKKILINGFISINGQKMSKSLGNVISPEEMVAKYGIDASRFLLISLGTFNEDVDVSWERLDEDYTANLSNGIGNLCSRVAKMSADEQIVFAEEKSKNHDETLNEYHQLMEHYELSKSLELIVNLIKKTDLFLSQNEPWKKSGEEKIEILLSAISYIREIGKMLSPFTPELSATILNSFQGEIKPLTPLFPRLS